MFIDHYFTSGALFYGLEVPETKNQITACIRSTLSDRVNMNHAAIQIVEEKLDTKLLELNCNLHPLDAISKTCREALSSISNITSRTFGKDCKAANLVYAVSKLRYKGSGDPVGFKLFLAKQGFSMKLFPRVVGNRFHVMFHSSGVIYCHRAKLIEYLQHSTSSCAALRTSVLADLQNADILTHLQALGMAR